MPRIVEIELTPNPNARKFILKEPLSGGVTRSYERADSAMGDALAKALFALPHVIGVFYVDRWLTLTQDGEAEWDALLRQAATVIRAAPSSNQIEGTQHAMPLTDSPEDAERLQRILDVLDRDIRPYLRGDGGDIIVLSLAGNDLTIRYQGACGTCAVSTAGTLSGIESRLRQAEPGLRVILS